VCGELLGLSHCSRLCGRRDEHERSEALSPSVPESFSTQEVERDYLSKR
jgi:hypothetical protein